MTDPRLRQAYQVLRAGRTATALRMLRDVAAVTPDDPYCRWLMGVAALDLDDGSGAIPLLEGAIAVRPDLTEARVDLARALHRVGRKSEARDRIREVLARDPRHHRAWNAYADILVDLQQHADARIAFERARLTDPQRERIERATAALLADDRRTSEDLFRSILQADAGHPAALAGLAALSLAADRPQDAERLLRHALKQTEHLPLAWRGLGPALLALGRLDEAEAAARHLVDLEPDSPQTWILLAGVATRLLQQETALDAYRRAARLRPGEVRLWLSLGHVHKTLGNRTESEAAYKAALELSPDMGEAWWSLADLKTYHFSDPEVATMRTRLADRPCGIVRARSDTAQLCFALGKAFEQRREYGAAFEHYARGNALRREDAPFDIEQFEQRSTHIRETFDAAFHAARRTSGDPSHAPIFIVGLPRSGSTLVEQILASHSQVQGTMELPNVLNLVRDFDDRSVRRDGYPHTVRDASLETLTALGRRYLEETAPLRRGRERFTDKLPNNFSHVGLINAILPNAVIIDARRHPLDACFSTYKQYFAEGQTFSYDLEDLGRYYRCYLSLMDHWDTVLPGHVFRVHYEALVRDPETHIRRLLDHCGLPFESRCLTFHTTPRAVRTASAEQVRQPIYTSGVGHWRHFAAQLEPLRRALGDSLERPDVTAS